MAPVVGGSARWKGAALFFLIHAVALWTRWSPVRWQGWMRAWGQRAVGDGSAAKFDSLPGEHCSRIIRVSCTGV